MDELRYKNAVAEAFEEAAEGYDLPAMRFFDNAAEELASRPGRSRASISRHKLAGPEDCGTSCASRAVREYRYVEALMASLGRAMTEAYRRPDLVAEKGKLRASIAPLCPWESVSRMPLLEATRALARVQ